jgi:hypothetical protein
VIGALRRLPVWHPFPRHPTYQEKSRSNRPIGHADKTKLHETGSRQANRARRIAFAVIEFAFANFAVIEFVLEDL